MSRIQAFRFLWTDAWNNISAGYDSIVETSERGDVIIKFLVQLKPFDMVLTGKENDFIEQLSFIKEWNHRYYEDPWVLDGDHWSIDFLYDDTLIRSAGANGYPKEFPLFLDILHRSFHLPYAEIDTSFPRRFTQDFKQMSDTMVNRPIYKSTDSLNDWLM